MPDESSMNGKLSLRLPASLLAQVQREAQDSHMKDGEYVRWVLTQHMRRVERQRARGQRQ
jgi:hypothetical protein